MSSTSSGPTALRDRAPGPDLARGVMLLGIALANSHYFLGGLGADVRGGFPVAQSGIDHVVTWTIATFVDGRAFPLFALLFGYGAAHIVRRQNGPARPTRRLLWRRAGILITIGLADALLLYVGDVLAAYGVLLVLGAWTVTWRDRWLLVWAALLLLLTALPSGESGSIVTDPAHISMVPPDLGTQLLERLVVAPYVMLLGPIGFAAPFLVGLVAGRHRLLEEPDRHRRLLGFVAVGGVAAAVLGAQPVALMLAGVTGVPDRATLELIGPLHDASGVLGGFGYAAAIALAATRLRGGRVTHALAATGQRSLTCYLVQSLAWQVLFAGYLLDLSRTLTVTTGALVAATVWLLSVVLASWLAGAGRRGPFEVLVRRVTYRSAPGLSVPQARMGP